jgi:hypothetical protein
VLGENREYLLEGYIIVFAISEVVGELVEVVVLADEFFLSDPITDGLLDATGDVSVVRESLVRTQLVDLPSLIIDLALHGLDGLEVLVLTALLKDVPHQLIVLHLVQLPHHAPLISLGDFVAALSDDGPCEWISHVSLILIVLLAVHLLLGHSTLILHVVLVELGEISLRDDSEGVKLFCVLLELRVLDGEVEVEDLPAYDLLKVEIGDDHEVDCIEVCRLPLDITGIGSAAEVLLLLVVEDESVVLMRQTLHVLL